MRIAAFLLSVLTITSLGTVACSTKSNPNPDASAGACASDFSVGWTNDALCAAGTGGNLGAACPAITPASTCLDSRPVAACCAWVADAKTELARAPTALHYYGAPAGNTTVDLGCVDTPVAQGTPQMVTVNGFVKVFLGQDSDSAGVKIEIYTADPVTGALGSAPIVPAVTTTATSASRTNTWLNGCPTTGCTERAFSIANVPTETPLVIHTSDANAAQKWADFYDYNIYFANSVVSAGAVTYDTTGVGTTDVLTVTATIGYSPAVGKGLLAGEVHDCGDVRLQNAEVNTDYRPQGDMFYFGSDETQPLPDKQAVATSDLGLFGAINYEVGVPIHISAVGMLQGQRKLIGAYTVQVYAGAVTGLSLRGRRPFQH